MKYLTLLLTTLMLMSCDPKDLQAILNSAGNIPLSNADIANGLKEALDKGVDQSVKTLAVKNGYYESVYKILLPQEAQGVIDKLKFIPGFANLEQEAIKKINQAAEDAASKAGPIFLSAIKQMTFEDVMNILMGDKNAATQYLHRTTYNPLYNEFKPVMVNSLNKFGVLDLWKDAINQYNSIPFITKVNPDMADHVTSKALVGLFSLVEKKEAGIRTDISQRTSDLLKRVFAKQDK
ncbi:MAG TPA: DUF4197 domain-containing protein [Saprospiraceae bacterium]|nr:DUF4197 domain-containing protein [Saprospiraceae bacterium]HRO08142.1 DUF4197 domain-containing protein [Saprospiraceae bacterium]HRP41535.1 DUF4197 domain-containing protein [Saprospiraceae bacterium]